MTKRRTILGVNFFTGNLDGLLDLTAEGGLIVVPSAPVLADLTGDPAHRQAVQASDLAIVDSGLLMLLWLAIKGTRLSRISGLLFIRSLLEVAEFRKHGATFWVMPSQTDLDANLAWLNKSGLTVLPASCYVAPHYPKMGHLVDSELVAAIERSKARYVIINLGGGVQERLGYYLREKLSYRPAIICTGAAIAFLSGRQTQIPSWADKAMLGWLLRCVSAPSQFVPRYWRARKLIPLVLKHGSKSPALARDHHGTA